MARPEMLVLVQATNSGVSCMFLTVTRNPPEKSPQTVSSQLKVFIPANGDRTQVFDPRLLETKAISCYFAQQLEGEC